MLHLVVVYFVSYAFRYIGIDIENSVLNGSLFACFCLLGAGGVAYLSYNFLEKPFLKMKNKIS
jgi:peptidoglycan/LPS O-acetylase OafA/YrhL